MRQDALIAEALLGPFTFPNGSIDTALERYVFHSLYYSFSFLTSLLLFCSTISSILLYFLYCSDLLSLQFCSSNEFISLMPHYSQSCILLTVK